jgi:cyclic-di-GMP-binding biofilm dispersal mediator protein
MTSLHDLSILVVGAGGGLGAPISRLLAAGGARLTLVGRSPDRLAAIGVPGALCTGDLRDGETPQRAVDTALAAYGGLDGVVIASGVVAFGPVGELPDDALTDLFLVNAIGPIRVLKAALPHLTLSASDGRKPFVVNLSAVVAEQPTAGMAAYSASKAALTAFDVAAAREIRRVGIRVIDARPPHTETGLADRPIAGSPPRLPQGLDPDAVATRVVRAIMDDETDLSSAAFK